MALLRQLTLSMAIVLGLRKAGARKLSERLLSATGPSATWQGIRTKAAVTADLIDFASAAGFEAAASEPVH